MATIDQVIKMRDTLKAGKNFPLRVYINNSFTTIDESNPTQFTKWDDNNGILYSYRLIDPQSDTAPNNAEQAIMLFACDYAEVQCMEIVRLPIKNISDTVQSIRDSGVDFSEDFENLINHAYTEYLHPDRWRLTHRDINHIVGSKLNDKDEYYENRFRENFAETNRYRKHNQEIDKKNGTKPYEDGINKIEESASGDGE